jgi:AcrR family transcriptional regulator
MAFSTGAGPATGIGTARRPASVGVALDDARLRSAEQRSAFVAAARELATETGSSAFTVQQVVARSGRSLKSFYRHFAGKDDLLAALLEEDIAVGALFLAEMVDAHRDPPARLEAWVTGLFDLLAAGDEGYVAVLVREYQRLGHTRTADLERAVSPFVDLLAGELRAAADAGAARSADPGHDARLVFELMMASIFAVVLGRDRRPPAEVARHVWRFAAQGLGVAPGGRPPVRRRRR